MSNSSNPPPVKMAEFVRYLDAVGATGPCSRCGHVGWSLITRPERPDLAATVALAATSEKEMKREQERDFRLLFGAIIATALGLAGLMAKGFGWL